MLMSCFVLCVGCRLEPSTQIEHPAIRQVDAELAVYVGGQLDGYEELQRMGFRSVIDVDATAPPRGKDLDLRIVHLPLRYSGITTDEARLLADAMASMDRPIYVHCHHGTNRAPAAAAVALVGIGEWTPDRGVRLLEVSGTDRAFAGLYDSVASSNVIPRDERMPIDQIDRTMEEFPVLMAGIDDSWAALIEDVERRRPATDVTARSAEFVDMLRVAFDADARMESESYRALANQVVVEATELEHALRGVQMNRVQILLDAVGATCTACHRQYRN